MLPELVAAARSAARPARRGRDWALLGTGLNGELGSGWSTYADYDLMINGQTTFHIGSGGVSYVW